SPATSNQYLVHIQAFVRWLVKKKKARSNPLEDIEPANAEADRRHDRRALTAEELERVLTVTRASKHVFRGLDGEARYHLYFVGCLTGFRASALASLTPAHFDLDGAVPVVILAAREDKG